MPKIHIVQVFGAIYNGHGFQQSFTVTTKNMLLKLTDSRIDSIFSDAANSSFRCTKGFLILRLHRSRSSESLLVPTQNAIDHFQQLIEAKIGDRQTASQPQAVRHSHNIYISRHSGYFLQTREISESLCVLDLHENNKTSLGCHMLLPSAIFEIARIHQSN